MRDRGTLSRLPRRDLAGWLDHHAPRSRLMPRRADIIVAAAGVPGLITADMVKPGAAVLDVGVSRTDDGLRGQPGQHHRTEPDAENDEQPDRHRPGIEDVVAGVPARAPGPVPPP